MFHHVTSTIKVQVWTTGKMPRPKKFQLFEIARIRAKKHPPEFELSGQWDEFHASSGGQFGSWHSHKTRENCRHSFTRSFRTLNSAYLQTYFTIFVFLFSCDKIMVCTSLLALFNAVSVF